MSEENLHISGDLTEAKDGGIIKEILVESTSEEKPSAGDTVVVHYVGRLTDGTEFDSSIARNEPFKFKLGKGQVIKGWDTGVATMRVGEKCRLTIKPEYGYGSDGAGEKIPGNSTLVFEVELLSIEGEDVSEERNGSVKKRTIKEGEGYQRPSDGSFVVVSDMQGHVVLANNEKTELKAHNRLEWVIGESESLDIPEGLECAIMKMKKGEKAKVEIDQSRFEGAHSIPKDAQRAVYTLTLESFEKAKESWQMNEEEKLEAAKVEKMKGAKYFKAGNYKQAIKRYKKMLDFVRVDSMSEEPEKAEQKELMLQANNNLAICYLKQCDYHNAIECADKVLEKEPKNEKALFRRGEARFMIGDWTEALQDFNQIMGINATNSAAAAKIRQVKEKMREYRKQEKSIFSKMIKGISSKKDEAMDEETAKKEEHKKPTEADGCCAGGDANKGAASCKEDGCCQQPTCCQAEGKQ